jgi:hypothetical protein
MDTVAVLIIISVIFTFLYLFWMRVKFMKRLLLVDKTTITPSKFSLVCKNFYFEDCSREGINKELRKYFKEEFGIENIVYINPAYDIANFYKLMAT